MKIKGQRTIFDWMNAEADKIARHLFINNWNPKDEKTELDYQRVRLGVPLVHEDLFKNLIYTIYRNLSIDIEGVDPEAEEDEEVQG